MKRRALTYSGKAGRNKLWKVSAARKNMLKNDHFQKGLFDTFENWDGWYMPPWGRSMVYLKKIGTENTGFYQDIPKSAFKSDGKYFFQMLLLTPSTNTRVSPTIWVFKKGQDPRPTTINYRLKKGQWQVIQVSAYITRYNLKEVRAELYYSPNNAEFIIQRAYFGR